MTFRDELILATVRHGLGGHPVPLPRYSGDLRADLLAQLRGLADSLNGPFGAILRAIFGETHRQPELMAALHEAVFDPRLAELQEFLREAAASGADIRPEVTESDVAGVGPELLMLRFLTEGAPVPDATVRGIVDDVVLPAFRKR